jgi:hypothetical protein
VRRVLFSAVFGKSGRADFDSLQNAQHSLLGKGCAGCCGVCTAVFSTPTPIAWTIKDKQVMSSIGKLSALLSVSSTDFDRGMDQAVSKARAVAIAEARKRAAQTIE